MYSITIRKSALILSASTLALPVSNAALLRITVEAPSNLGLAPAAISFHDGSNDFFDTGSAASAGLEVLAELGGTGPLLDSLTTGDNISIMNSGGPFTPGSSNSAVLEVDEMNTTFSFASMLLPSNDWFIGNNNGIDVSSLLSGALGTTEIFEFGRVYDAGTELENFSESPGNPFIGLTAGNPAASTAQNGVVTLVDAADPFSAFLNADAGFDSSLFDFNANGVGETVLGRVTITVIPEPSTALLSALAGLGLLARRRR